MKIEPSSWEAKLQQRREFCDRFVREHHPGMADAHKIKGAHPLKPLDGPRTIHGSIESDWWLQTNECMCELGFTNIATLFKRHGLLDHAWMIGRSDQEPWALVSEPYSHVTAATIAKLRSELEPIGVDLIQYPSEQSTHAPGHALMLVANVVSIYSLMGAVARLIVAACPPLRIDNGDDGDDEELSR